MATKRKEFIKQLMGKSVTELRDMLKKAQEELFFMTMKNKVRALQQTHLLKSKKLEIARINTILTAKVRETHGNIGG
jgi:ribosomal protein L29